MGRIEKTVFISYRRTNAPWALAVFQYLTQHGYDVFFDYNGIASGDFERVILENIAARAHFVLLLTPSAIERCGEANDWLRREIEVALSTQRNIIPLMLDGFSFDSPAIASQLTGTLALLRRYNSLVIPAQYFMEAMGRLSDRFLNVPLDAVLHPVSPSVQLVATDQKSAATIASAVTRQELTAQEWFERGLSASTPEEKIHLFTEALRLDSGLAPAFTLRGYARCDLGDLPGAMDDCNEAIRLKPDYAAAFMNRALVRLRNKDLDGAMLDCNEAIRLKPDLALSFNSRGIIRAEKHDFAGAIDDYNEAIRLDPKLFRAFMNRACARFENGDLAGAIEDCDEVIRLQPDYAMAFHDRGIVRMKRGDYRGAIADYSVALRLDPRMHSARQNRAYASIKSGNVGNGVLDGIAAIVGNLRDKTVLKATKNTK